MAASGQGIQAEIQAAAMQAAELAVQKTTAGIEQLIGGAPFIPKTMFIYEVNVGAAVFVAILSCIIAVVHCYQFIRYKSWFLLTFPQATIANAIGYSAKAYYSQHVMDNTTFTAAGTCVKISDAVYAIGLFMTFSRVVWWATPPEKRGIRHTFWSSNFSTFLFGLMFCVGEVIVGISAEYIGDAGGTVAPIFYNLMAGTCFTFAAIVARFMVVSTSWRTTAPHADYLKYCAISMMGAILLGGRALYIDIAFMERLEFNAFIRRVEWPTGLYDTLPFLIIPILFIAVHPGTTMPKPLKETIILKKKTRQALDDSDIPLSSLDSPAGEDLARTTTQDVNAKDVESHPNKEFL